MESNQWFGGFQLFEVDSFGKTLIYPDSVFFFNWPFARQTSSQKLPRKSWPMCGHGVAFIAVVGYW